MSHLSSHVQGAPFMDHSSDFIVVAHRGFSSHFPENTMVAFEGAYEAGKDYGGSVHIELDVWCLKTGEPVVIHSALLSTTTNKTGFVFNSALEEIKKADAAAHFKDSNGEPFRQGVQIPTLKEVCEWANSKEKPVQLFIELKGPRSIHPEDKGYGEIQDAGHSTAEVAKNVYEVVKQNNRHHHDYFISFQHIYVQEIRKLDQAARIGFSAHTPTEKIDLIDKAIQYKAEGVMLNHILMTQEFVDEAKSHNLKVWTYTLLTKEHLERVKAMGVDAGCLNDVHLGISST